MSPLNERTFFLIIILNKLNVINLPLISAPLCYFYKSIGSQNKELMNKKYLKKNFVKKINNKLNSTNAKN